MRPNGLRLSSGKRTRRWPFCRQDQIQNVYNRGHKPTGRHAMCIYVIPRRRLKAGPKPTISLMGTPTDFWLASFGWLDPDRSGRKRQRRRPQRPPHMHTSAGPCAAGARGRRSGGRSRGSGAQRQMRTVRSVWRKRKRSLKKLAAVRCFWFGGRSRWF